MDNIASVTSAASNNSASASTQSEVGEEFNTFLRLLTAQIRNQDPLAPLDSTQFVEQLATFSTLEQQVRSNNSLESIAVMMNDVLTLVASEWLGETVSIESSWVPYTGATIQFEADIPDDADKAVLTIRDSQGKVVRSETLDMNEAIYGWNGLTESGESAVTDSLYKISIDIYRQGEFAGSIAPRIVTTVTDVANEGGKLRLGTSSHLTTDLDNARKLSNE